MKKSVVSIGEVLFDVYPLARHMGGAPLNFAYHMHRLGAEVFLASRVGTDAEGEQICSFLERSGMSKKLIQHDSLHPTGTVHVDLDSAGVPSFTINPQSAWDYLDPGPSLMESAKKADIVYYGTLALRAPHSRSTILSLLRHIRAGACGNPLLFLDINLRTPWYTPETLHLSLSLCNYLKTNEEELKVLRQILETPQGEESTAKALMAKFGISGICVTKGDQGAAFYTEENVYSVSDNHIHQKAVVDTVGAGDGFSAVLAAGLLLGLHPENIIKEAHWFASSLCGLQGAIPVQTAYHEEILNRLSY